MSAAFNYNSLVKRLEKDLVAVNSPIEALIKNDPELNRLFCLLTAIAGIGVVTATGFIRATRAFTDGKTAKQFAGAAAAVTRF